MAVLLLYVLLLLGLPALAQTPSAGTEIARVILVTNSAQAVDATGSVRQLLRGDFIHSDERIQTLGGGRVQMRLTDNSLILLGSGTDLEIVQYEYDGPGGSADSAVYHLHTGCMRTVTGSIGEEAQDECRLVTDYGEVRINGTIYRCTVDGGLFCGVSDG